MTFVAPNLACGEARGGRIPCHGAVTDEQRSHRPNSAQPGGRQVFFAQTSLLAPHRSTAGYARRSRLVWAKNPLPRTSSYLCLRPLRAVRSRAARIPMMAIVTSNSINAKARFVFTVILPSVGNSSSFLEYQRCLHIGTRRLQPEGDGRVRCSMV